MPQSLTTDNISHIAAEFWSTMPAVELCLVQNLNLPSSIEEGILGRIEIRGAWSGEIELRASRSLAMHTAGRLLEKQLEDVTVEECFDAIQEATNIVAGGIKRLLPPICRMTLPSMSGCSSREPKGSESISLRALFNSEAGELSIFVISISERLPSIH